MQTDTEGFTEIVANQMGKMTREKDIGGLYVEFHVHPVLNEEKSTQEGRPIYEDKDYIRIYTPGDKSSVVDRPIWPIDIMRFGPEYEKWKITRKTTQVTGTPLTAVVGAWLTQGQVAELAHFNVRTVEHLAEMPDVHAQKFAGIQALKGKAKEFLAAASGTAPIAQMRKEMEEKDAKLSAQETMLAEMRDRLEKLEQRRK